MCRRQYCSSHRVNRLAVPNGRLVGTASRVVVSRGAVPDSVSLIRPSQATFRAANLSLQMLWGLGYLHYEHHVHRDVKPQNVLLNK